MKTKTLFTSLLLFSMLFTVQVSFAQLPRETEAQKAERMKWWTDAWAKMAKAAGMKYVVLTAKHHEGFCNFDSKYTDYKSTNTPFGRDIIKEYVEAFRSEGLKVGFYYSLIDWHHPDYTIDSNHPQRQTSDSAYARLNKGRDMNKYREYIKNQVRELLTNYGEISVIWFDFSFPGKHGKGHDDWDSENLLKMVRSLQPGIIVDDRLEEIYY